METFPVAYVSIHGAGLTVVFLDPAFDSRTPRERSAAYVALQHAAASQGFQGDVAALWEDALGRTRFIAPAPQHPFFQVMNYAQLRAQANGTIHVSSATGA